MKLVSILVAGFILTGCATQPSVVKVEVPVVVGCVHQPIPVAPVSLSDAFPSIETEEDAGNYGKALKHDLRAFQAYSQELEVVVAGCPLYEEKSK